jgi:hypothetical protein
MTPAISQQGIENRQYVRRLLKQKQPEFSAALELALVLAELKLWQPQPPRQASAGKAHGGNPASLSRRTSGSTSRPCSGG